MRQRKWVKVHQLDGHVFATGTPYCPIQMMSYVIETEEGSLVVIDGGNVGDDVYLMEYLQKLGGENPRIAAWFITHAHCDHLGALDTLLAKERQPYIEKIYVNIPDEGFQRANFPESIVPIFSNFLKRIQERQIPMKKVEIGDEIQVDNATFKIIYFAGEDITCNQPNNGSVVIRMEACGQSVLFTGDIGVEACADILSKVDKGLIHNDIVQMSHHGQCGASQMFYQAVNPKACMWPTPKWLWENDFGEGYNTHTFRTLETRSWMKELGVKHHVVTKDGTQVITLPVNFDESWGIEDCLQEQQ